MYVTSETMCGGECSESSWKRGAKFWICKTRLTKIAKKKIDPNEIDRFNELPTGSILVAAVSNVVSIFKLSCFCIDMFKSKGYLTFSLNQGVNCISTKGKQYQSVLLTF